MAEDVLAIARGAGDAFCVVFRLGRWARVGGVVFLELLVRVDAALGVFLADVFFDDDFFLVTLVPIFLPFDDDFAAVTDFFLLDFFLDEALFLLETAFPPFLALAFFDVFLDDRFRELPAATFFFATFFLEAAFFFGIRNFSRWL